ALPCEPRGRSVPPDAACGRGLACTTAARGLHPDVRVFLPHPKLDKHDARPDDYAERLQRLFQNPYAPVDYRSVAKLDASGASNKQSEYRIKQIDAIRHEVGFVPGEGPYTVGVLTNADWMRGEAANAFLKLLEEPPERTVLVLTAERTDALLPTILSRCQRLRFDPLPAAAIEAALGARQGVDPARAAFVARMADGSYARALALLENEALAERRELAVAFMRAAYGNDPATLPPLVERIARSGREPVKQLLGLLLGWVRDLVLYRAAGEAAPLVNVDQAEAVRSFVENLPAARLEAMAELIEEAAERLERNVHTGLLLTVLAGALGEAMRGAPRARLFPPLTEPAG
ncbi:MAG: DNA polymerase III subunit delta' C-terminal domain-containing protein, partial [Rubricoccaceae bacterium]|nr:DNA polymerase III subunit delta' C-terminal domain-containing protein [Rubricoccaceae bacterium]